MPDRKRPLTRLIALGSTFAALDILFAVIPVIPYGPSVSVLLKPSEGIFLGPVGGVFAALVGGVVSSVIWPSTAVLGLATWIPGVFGAFSAGMLLKRKWMLVTALMVSVIVAFYVHPFGRGVFLYANWDKVIALALIYPSSRVIDRGLKDRKSVKTLMPAIGLTAFIATEIDSAIGNLIFLVEAGPIFGLTSAMLPAMFIPYMFLDPIVRLLVGAVCALVLTPTLVGVEKANLLTWPLT